MAGLLWSQGVLAQGVPESFNYQGTLFDADANGGLGAAITGNQDLTVRLYALPTDLKPAALWARTFPISATADGVFNVQIDDSGNWAGTVAEIDLKLIFESQSGLYMGLEIASKIGEISPRQKLTSSPYALKAAAADIVTLEATYMVPIGTILDWWRPPGSSVLPPAGYQICDGSVINDSDSPYDGNNVPDLVNRFVRGVLNAGSIGPGSGTDSHNHSVSFTHASSSVVTLSAHSHVALKFNGTNKTWSEGDNGLLVDWDNGVDNEGSGSYPVSINQNTGSNRDVTTSSAGNHTHSHTVAAHSGNSGNGNNLPPYVGLLKIMRIK